MTLARGKSKPVALIISGGSRKVQLRQPLRLCRLAGRATAKVLPERLIQSNGLQPDVKPIHTELQAFLF